MNGFVVMPSKYKGYVTDKFDVLFELLEEEFGFDLLCANVPEIPKDTDVVLFIHPHNWKPVALHEMINLDKKIKVIGYFTDINAYLSPLPLVDKLLNRCDVILSSNNAQFHYRWPDYADQFVHFPNCFAPHDRYAGFEYNKDPIKKCLLFGRHHKYYYPIRQHVFDHGDDKIIKKIPHPGGSPGSKVDDNKFYLGDRFAELINSYFCSVTAASIYGGTISKYFEIPAAGGLLIANEVPDLKSIGYVAGEHYISVTKDNVLDKISACLASPEKYEKIRREGMLYTRNNHSIRNRYEQLKEIIKGI